MPHPSSLLIISNEPLSFAQSVAAKNGCVIVATTWDDAAAAIDEEAPAAVIAEISEGCEDVLRNIANGLLQVEPYVPLIGLGAPDEIPDNLLPGHADADERAVSQRLNAALRVRTLHATVLRRAQENETTAQPGSDLLGEATALLLGRGPSFPGLSVAIGEQMNLVGALSVEAAARHLNIRDIDGIFIGEGFSTRMIDAFLTVLAEDVRFRNLPVIMTGRLAGASTHHDLANIEIITGEPATVVKRAAPLIRQHAFEIRLNRSLEAIESKGLLDARTGLMTPESFDRDFTQTVSDTLTRGGHLSAAQISFETDRNRACIDAARIVSRLMRKMDFAALQEDGSIIAAFAETDLRAAHVIARRLASILQSTLLGSDGHPQINPRVTLATLKANDSAAAMRERLTMTEPPAQPDLRTRLSQR